MNRRRQLQRWASLLDCPSHLGGLMTLVNHVEPRAGLLRPPLQAFRSYMHNYTDRRAAQFDRVHGTDTFERINLEHLSVGPSLPDDEFRSWRTGPINEDFFHEILRRCPAEFSKSTFVDVGSGKGLACLLADQYGFAQNVGVEFAPELIDIAKSNVAKYSAVTGKRVNVQWVHADFMTYEPPPGPRVFFLNNPFPPHISARAVEHIENLCARNRNDDYVIYRRASRETKDQLERSSILTVVRQTPYWMILRSAI